ncbi:hypothetical protein D3C87_1974910 [compost metagenome]
MHRAGCSCTEVLYFNLVDYVGFALDLRPVVIGMVAFGFDAGPHLTTFTGHGVFYGPFQLPLPQHTGRQLHGGIQITFLDQGVD